MSAGISRDQQWRGTLKKQTPLALHTLSPIDRRAGSSVKRSNSNQNTNFKVWSLLESFIQLQRSCLGSHGSSKPICLSTCLHAASFAAFLDAATAHDLRKFTTYSTDS